MTSEKTSVFHDVALSLRDIEGIEKGNVNEQQRFRYRSIEAIVDETKKAMKKHLVFIVPVEILDQERTIKKVTKNYNGRETSSEIRYCTVTIKFRVYNSHGDFFEGVGIGEGFDSGDKSTGKASTYAFKDFLSKLFLVSSGMNDPDEYTDDSYSETICDSSKERKIKEPKPNSQKENNYADVDSIKKKELWNDLKQIFANGGVSFLEKRFNELTKEEKELMGGKTTEVFNKIVMG